MFKDAVVHQYLLYEACVDNDGTCQERYLDSLPLVDNYFDKDPQFLLVLAHQGIQVTKEQNTMRFDVQINS
jgi:hypothetical protein